MNEVKNLGRLNSRFRLRSTTIEVLVTIVCLMAFSTLVGCSDIYDVDKLPRYDNYGQRPGTAWLLDDMHGTWWCYVFRSSELKSKRKANSLRVKNKTKSEKLVDVRYLDGLVRGINSKMPDWEWSWNLQHKSSYVITGKGPGSDWLSYDLKSRKEFLVEIYEKAVEATQVTTRVNIIDEQGAWLGRMNGGRVDTLIRLSPRRAAEQALNDQVRPLCKYLNERHSKYSSISPKWTWEIILDHKSKRPVSLWCDVQKTPSMSMRKEFLSDASSMLAAYGLDGKVISVIVERKQGKGRSKNLALWRSTPRKDLFWVVHNRGATSEDDLKKFKKATLNARFGKLKLFSKVHYNANELIHILLVEVTKRTYELWQSSPKKYWKTLRTAVDKQYQKHVVSEAKRKLGTKKTDKGKPLTGMPLSSIFHIYYHEPGVGDLMLGQFEEKWKS